MPRKYRSDADRIGLETGILKIVLVKKYKIMSVSLERKVPNSRWFNVGALLDNVCHLSICHLISSKEMGLSDVHVHVRVPKRPGPMTLIRLPTNTPSLLLYNS